ncbi:DUF3515 domain-containing protein [Solihabitans fulvus]|uniref:DUF3515 domain-containing protein n=1 Tax=Solihabitans fulvus TaxID=1892852 RepID=A0A5B2WSX6_9PSEU|nr:DUF3515 domain-containing protein [Solihabitans fulvus]
MLVVVIGLPVLLAVAVAAAGLFLGTGGRGDSSAAASSSPAADRSGPLPLVPVPAPSAGSQDCVKLAGALPAKLVSGGATLTRRELAAPAPVGATAWGDASHDPVVLRCGLDKPSELTQTSNLREINGVKWLEVDGDGAATWYVLDRPVYVALTVPADAGTGPLQDISTTIAATLPAKQ